MNKLKFRRLPEKQPMPPVRPARPIPSLCDYESITAYVQDQKRQPLNRAQDKFFQFVNKCVTDPDFKDEQSRVLLDFLLMSRDLLTDGINDQWTLDDILAPIMGAMNDLSAEDGKEGGSRPKRRLWADEAARMLVELEPKTEEAAWAALPTTYGSWKIETEDADYEVYSDGGKIIAEDEASKKIVGSLTKNSFLKNYFRKARKNGK